MVEIPYRPEEPRTIRLLFTRIAKNYDLTNHVISLGFDILWRKKFARLLKDRNKIADVCCGSGAMFPLLGNRILAGLDFTRAMLQIAARYPGARLVEGDAQKIPFEDQTFDATIIVYSIRNIPDLSSSLAELYRVLQTGGMVGILDFGVPEGRFLKWLYLLYFQKLMPFLGSFVARDKSSYYYFVNSVLRFPKRKEFLELMQKAGFTNCRYLEYMGGAALVYLGEKF
ncbi:ubiquinone/menaquinone biosynthesis methyltransferase [bacterium]|nr:ubiquinone/menaquinone biosynthesis methyltransferase [bacterium]MCI0604210.1 ubiquinone/menaquinone biosynthesis methyltransferase [bacterium]